MVSETILVSLELCRPHYANTYIKHGLLACEKLNHQSQLVDTAPFQPFFRYQVLRR